MDADQIIFERGDVEIALAFAALFVPTFTEVEGQIFLRDFAPKPAGWLEDLADKVRDLRSNATDLKHFVDSSNWFEVPYLFSKPTGDEDCYRSLAVSIATSWDAVLKKMYPQYKFTTRIIEPEETGSTIGVGFERLA